MICRHVYMDFCFRFDLRNPPQIFEQLFLIHPLPSLIHNSLIQVPLFKLETYCKIIWRIFNCLKKFNNHSVFQGFMTPQINKLPEDGDFDQDILSRHISNKFLFPYRYPSNSFIYTISLTGPWLTRVMIFRRFRMRQHASNLNYFCHVSIANQT